MADPILALKWFCLFLVIGIVLHYAHKAAVIYRVNYGKVKFFVSNLEFVLMGLYVIDCLLAVGCIIWSIISWIVS